MEEGYRVVGFDVERHAYGDAKYPAQLVLQDVLTIHGSQFKDAALIVASPPCQAYSYRAMPWKRAKALPPPDNSLFEACFRIQREAIAAAGHFIPLVVENVCGAQKWVGRAKWHYGSFYLWGDIPALMPIIAPKAKVGGITFSGYGTPGYKPVAFNGTAETRLKATKNDGRSWLNVAHNTQIGKGQNPVKRISEAYRSKDPAKGYGAVDESTGIKQGGDWFNSSEPSISRRTGSKSMARKAASAHIAKIPLPLSRHIARAWWPTEENRK